MRAASKTPHLPEWNAVCRKIVDDESGRRRCRHVLEGVELGAATTTAKPSLFDTILQGEGGAWLTLLLPVLFVGGLLLFSGKKKEEEDESTG